MGMMEEDDWDEEWKMEEEKNRGKELKIDLKRIVKEQKKGEKEETGIEEKEENGGQIRRIGRVQYKI